MLIYLNNAMRKNKICDRIDICIRRMRRGDAMAVAKMMKKLAAFHGDTSVSKAGDFVRHCLGPRKIGKLWVACIDGKQIGFAQTFDCVDFIRNIVLRELNLLYVDEAFRKQRVGESLVAHVAKDALENGTEVIFSIAIANNRIANHFYERIGMTNSADSDKRKTIKYLASKGLLKKMAKSV